MDTVTDMNKKTIYALGFFDGVHLGHQALLRECCRMAKELGCKTAAITFEQHPQTILGRDCPPLINNLEDRVRLLRYYGMETVQALPVTPEVMSRPWEAFLEDLVSQGAGGFVCGYDFRFGHKGLGTGEKLTAFCRQRGLACAVVPEQTAGGIRVSSTHIRQLLEQGDPETAKVFLGHPHILTGVVKKGKQLGRTLGIPTANLHLSPELAVPAFGVYACRCRIDGKYHLAVTNVGVRPTVSGFGITVEPWILDYTGDLYDRTITLEFHKFLRPEEKFPDLESLRLEIRKNARQTREYFGAMEET